MALTDRDDVAALIPEEAANTIIQKAEEQSAAMQLFQHVPMSRKSFRMPVLSAVPTAYWLSGDTDRKKTSSLAWENKYLTAEPLAVILPFPEDVLDDAAFDVEGQATNKLAEAFAIALDAAVLMGISRPSTWGPSVLEHADAAGNELVRGSVGSQRLDVDISDVMALVEADGYDVNGFAARRALRGALRGLRDDNGQPILGTVNNQSMLYGEDIAYVSNDAWDASEADLLAMDRSGGMIGVRSDITYKRLTEAVIQDPDTGDIVYNLAQDDMVAIRAVARFAWQVPNPINRENRTANSRSPFAILRPTGFVGSGS